MSSFDIDVTRDGGWWMVHIPARGECLLAVNTPRGVHRDSGPPLPADSSHDEHVAGPVWPAATHKGKPTARRLVITFVPTTDSDQMPRRRRMGPGFATSKQV
jgi:hypothetical protein